MSLPYTAKAQRELSDVLGVPFVVRPHQTIVNYSADPSFVMVVLDFLVTQETVRELRFIKKGTRIMQWRHATVEELFDDSVPKVYGNDAWVYTEVTVVDPDFKPYVEHKIGRIETPAEYAERRRWEGEQYRVGTHKSPMDSAQRVCDGPSPMTDYWNK